jgi:BNR repeat-like domain
MVCFNGGFLYSMVIARSQDGGVTWSPRAVIKNSWGTGDVEDKEFLAVDNHSGSRYFGRLYSCWNHNNNQVIAFSSDGGATWTERDLPAPPQGGIDINCDMAVQKNGTVHLVLETISCSGGDCQNEYLYHMRSSDGGNTWSAPSLVATTNFVSYSSASCPAAQDFRCLGSLGSIDVDNTKGPCEGTVYIAYSDFATGSNVENMDILLRRSTNGGATWSAATKVNDDATSNIQFNPFMSVDPIKGQPMLAWVDGRNDPSNLSTDVYAARSVNCGKNFKKNVKVTQPSSEFNNSTISYSNESSAANPQRNANQYGDYMGIDARNGKAYVAWTDSRHFFPSFQTEPQRENIGFAAVTFGPPAPENLTLTLGHGLPRISWDYTPPADLAALNVYLVLNGVYTKLLTIPASLLKTSTSHTLSLEKSKSGQAPSVVVAAVDTEGEEGPYSNPITVVVAN